MTVTSQTRGEFDVELAFTKTYRQYQHEHVALREAHCLRVLYPAYLAPLHEGDLFAGRVSVGRAGFDLQEHGMGATGGYGCDAAVINARLAEGDFDPDYRRAVEDMVAFWAAENTQAKHRALFSPEVAQGLVPNGICHGGIRLAGCNLDFDTLLQRGLPGMRAEVERHQARAAREGGDVPFYEGLLLALDLVVDVFHWYADACRGTVRQLTDCAPTTSPGWRDELLTIAVILEKLTVAAPETFREAMQLYWLYAQVAQLRNHGRMDVYLGDFYADDIDSGRLSEEEALRLTQSLWRLIVARNIRFDSRVIVGGKGRRNEANADRFALLAMEATRTVVEVIPQLTLRHYRGQNPALMQKALDVIGEGRTYPMLYNDDANIPAVQKAFGVSEREAEQYLPYGCGEYTLDHRAAGSPNCHLNTLKALDVALHNGWDSRLRQTDGLQTGDFLSFETFEQLFSAYSRQVEHAAWVLAARHACEYQAERENVAFLLTSLLTDDCLARGKSLVDGGARYRGAILETFGNTNAADSLAAIKKLVYDEKVLTREELLAALDADFVGYEGVHRLLQAAPKYGNDDDAADAMLQAVSRQACLAAIQQAEKVGMDYLLIVNINNFSNVTQGAVTAASADGRRAGDPLANGNGPTAGGDRSGVTAFLNSIVKPDPSLHAGYVHNMKFSRAMFGPDRPKLEALLDTYWANGGTQAMITVVSRGDLEAALQEPEKYANLIVRVGGYSARFVELPHAVQQDLLKRTLY